ncbi:bestrophin family ion channel [Mesorhizobium tamadayense]|uniref:bestrophin family ion channel n=1 Tax=Mesorhizobium tamadayense TaxID=425306 RepID=UPI001FDF646C|nr:bestrophin family ion channel [Mesorhizobium tamadayense]
MLDFALWSRRSIIYMVVVSGLAIAAYRLPATAGLSVPWSIVLVLGTTVSLVAGFKNSQVFTRSNEALQAFSQITASSRMWSILCRDFTDAATARRLIYRHLAWLTALRFSLRRPMPWESLAKAANIEFRRRRYHIQEDKTSLGDELRRLLGEEGEGVLKSPQPAIALLDMQSAEVAGLLKSTGVPTQVYSELMKLVRDFHDQ